MRLIDADKLIKNIDYSADLGGALGKVVEVVKTYAKFMVQTAPTIKPQQWIPCSERLPEKEQWNDAFLVTVQCEHVDGRDDYVVCSAEYSSEYGWVYIPYPVGALKVVAWMSVQTEPYREEQSDEAD